MLHGACLFQGKKQGWWDFHVLSLTKRDKGWEGEWVEETWYLSFFAHFYECDWVCTLVFLWMQVCVCLGEVLLTCKQAHVSLQGMTHDPGNTVEDKLQITHKETAEYHIYTHKGNLPKLLLFSVFLSSSISLFTWQETEAHSSMLLPWHKKMKSVTYVAEGGNCALYNLIH